MVTYGNLLATFLCRDVINIPYIKAQTIPWHTYYTKRDQALYRLKHPWPPMYVHTYIQPGYVCMSNTRNYWAYAIMGTYIIVLGSIYIVMDRLLIGMYCRSIYPQPHREHWWRFEYSIERHTIEGVTAAFLRAGWNIYLIIDNNRQVRNIVMPLISLLLTKCF